MIEEKEKKGKVFITGVSSGIGRALTKELVKSGYSVWGVARRRKLLKDLQKEISPISGFKYSSLDITGKNSWKKIIKKLKKESYFPDVIIFNAAILENDLSPKLNTSLTRKIFDNNFFSIIGGVESLLDTVRPGTQFILISSLSAFKGSGVEGIGYGASKAAISLAFETLHRKFGKKYSFQTVYFGPIATGMGPFKKKLPIILSEKDAVLKIIHSMRTKTIILHHPWILFFAIKTIKLMPSQIYFYVLDLIEKIHMKLEKEL